MFISEININFIHLNTNFLKINKMKKDLPIYVIAFLSIETFDFYQDTQLKKFPETL